MTKPKVVRQPTTERVMTIPAQQRAAAMNACAPIVTQPEIVNLLAERDVKLSRASVGMVLAGEFYNADAARAFCDLTDTKLSAMWPEFVDENGRERPSARSSHPKRRRPHQAHVLGSLGEEE